MGKQNGFSLIGVLVIIGVLTITASGLLVWRKKVLPTLTPTPTPTSSPSHETLKVPPENTSKIEDVSQFCGLEGLKKLSLSEFPVIRVGKCGSLYRLFRECCDAPDVILDENFNFVAKCGGFPGYSEECTKLVSHEFSHGCIEVVKCKL